MDHKAWGVGPTMPQIIAQLHFPNPCHFFHAHLDLSTPRWTTGPSSLYSVAPLSQHVIIHIEPPLGPSILINMSTTPKTSHQVNAPMFQKHFTTTTLNQQKIFTSIGTLEPPHYH